MVAAYAPPAHDPIMAFTADEWDAMAARASLRAFSRRTFPGYERAPHITQLVEALEWAVNTPGARLIVTMPPRHSKSLHVSELLPAWYVGRNPGKRVIAASHSAHLAYTFSRRVRNLIGSPRYPFPVAVAGDKAAVQAWDTEGHRGGYIAVGVGGSPTGQGGDLIVIDDPIRSAGDADSETVRSALWEWYQGTIRTRLEPGGSIIVTSTRWHEDDLTGRLLAAEKAGGEHWRHVHMPALTEDGDALWPGRWPVSALTQIRQAVGSRTWQAQYQGEPTPDEGGIFKRHWWRFWHHPDQPLPPVTVSIGGVLHSCPVVPLPETFDRQAQSWDMSFKETKAGSYTVGQVWGKAGVSGYLLDQYRARVDFPDAVAAVRSLSERWPKATAKYVENKANGPAIVSSLRDEISGLIEVDPDGGKEARAHAVTPLVEAGNVILPHPLIAPWVTDLIDEAAAMPNGKHDDQVDAMSQGLRKLLTGGGEIKPVSGPLLQALESWFDS
jgi:predicted phage terminase large subunit-like protein